MRTENFPLREIGTWEKVRYNGGYVVTIVCCMRTENFPLREIGTWEKVRYNGGYVVNGVRYNDSTLCGPRIFHYVKSGPGKKYVITVGTL